MASDIVIWEVPQQITEKILKARGTATDLEIKNFIHWAVLQTIENIEHVHRQDQLLEEFKKWNS